MRKLVFAGLVAALAVTGSGIARAGEPVRFLLASARELPTFAPYILADYLGYFKEENLDVEFLSARGGVDAAKQVGAGNADIGSGMGDTTIFVRGNGVPVKAVAVLGGGGLMQLAVRQDAGIKGLADLRGKTIAVIAYTDTTYYSLLGMLASVGLSKNDVSAQAVGGGAIVQMMASNKMPVCACIPDYTIAVNNAGVETKLFPSSEYTPSMAQALIASDTMIKEKPEMLRKVLRAVMHSFSQLRDDPVNMAGVYAKAVPSHAAEVESLKRVYSMYAKYVYSGQKKTGHMDPEKLDKLEDLYVSQNVIKTKLPVADLYTNDLLPQ